MTTIRPRDLGKYGPAPSDEPWLRGAALIDGAYAAAHALNEQLLAQARPPVAAGAPAPGGGATEKEEAAA